MKVIMVEKPDSEKITIGMYYNVGHHDEPLEDQGVLDIINSYIDRHGGKHFSKDDSNSKSENPNRINTKQSVKTNLDYTYILTPDIEKEQIDSVFYYYSSLITNPPFNPNDLDSIRINLREYYKGKEFIRPGMLFDQGILDESHPYKFSNKSQNIERIGLEKTKDFFSKYFNPSTATLIVIGDISFKEIINLSIKNFNHIAPLNTIPKDPDFSNSFEKHYGKTLSYKVSASELGEEAMLDIDGKKIELYFSMAGLFFPLPSSRHPDIIVINSIFKLLAQDYIMRGDFYNNFHEKANNSVLTDYTLKKNLSFTGAKISHFNVFIGTSIRKMKKHFFKAIDHLGENGFDQEIIDTYRKRYLLNYFTKENDLDLLKEIGNNELTYGDYKNFTYNTINALSNDDIKRIIKTYFSKEKVIYYKIAMDKKPWWNPIGSLFYRSIRMIFDLGNWF